MVVRDTKLMRYRVHGFTLLELIVTLAVLSILVATAVPSFRDILIQQRVRDAAENLHISLMLTRSEAVKRNAQVQLDAENGDWTDGWVIVPVAGGNNIRQQDAMNDVTIAEAGGLDEVVFNRDGRAVANFAFEVCSTAAGQAGRSVTVTLTGISKVDVIAAGGGGCP